MVWWVCSRIPFLLQSLNFGQNRFKIFRLIFHINLKIYSAILSQNSMISSRKRIRRQTHSTQRVRDFYRSRVWITLLGYPQAIYFCVQKQGVDNIVHKWKKFSNISTKENILDHILDTNKIHCYTHCRTSTTVPKKYPQGFPQIKNTWRGRDRRELNERIRSTHIYLYLLPPTKTKK